MKDDAAHTTPTESTREAESRDATRRRAAGSEPTQAEEAAAERGKAALSPEAAENYEEYLKKASKAKGEGRIP
jgi:hypothetical protein